MAIKGLFKRHDSFFQKEMRHLRKSSTVQMQKRVRFAEKGMGSFSLDAESTGGPGQKPYVSYRHIPGYHENIY